MPDDLDIDIDIELLDKEGMQALLTDGRWVPVTNRFSDEPDEEGKRTEVWDWGRATMFVCGEGNIWLAAPVSVCPVLP